VRFRDEAGGVRTEVPTPGAALTPLRQLHAAPREGAYADFHERPRREPRQSAVALSAVPSSKPIRIYPYGLNRSRLEQLVRGLQLPVQVSLEPRNADVVLTLKSYYRRKPQALRDAEAVGTPVYVLRNSSGGQLQEGLQRVVQLLDTTPVSSGALAADALQETQEAISHVIETSRSVELSPQSAYIRRLQHQLAEEYGLVSRSYGKEPNRHVKLFAHDE
jgi:hypothetical protein